MARVAFEEMERVIAAAFRHAGMAPEDASRCATIHTESTCDGVNSHGLNRVPRFADYLRRGLVKAGATPSPVRQLGPLEVYDGNLGPGTLNALFATDRAMELASADGVGIVALRNTTHWMRGGTYGWRAAEQGYVAIAWTNTESCMPAWGSRAPRVGNNPFVMAAPRTKGHVVLDMAMSQYSYGKLQTTRLKGQTLPFPAGFDEHGVLTNEPGPVELSQRVLPIGYWKGSGFAILLDLLATILSQGLSTEGMDKQNQGSCTGCSQIFMLFDPRQLGGAAFADQVADSVADYVNSSPLAEDATEVLYPGQGALRTRLKQRQSGIVVDDGVWNEVLGLAGEVG